MELEKIINKMNKGEWSELYAILKLLAEGKLYLFNDLLEHNNEFYSILKINSLYTIDDNYIYWNNDKLNKNQILNKLSVVLDSIKQSKGSSFSLSELSTFLHSKAFTKANSLMKSDVYLDIKNDNFIKENVGFNIKSYLGSKPTLLNASKSTNFIYKVINMNDDIMTYVNNINTKNKIRDRVSHLNTFKSNLKFDLVECEIFANNLMKIDSLLPNILSDILLLYYSNGISNFNLFSNLLSSYKSIDIALKLKQFLLNSALGFTPSKVWDGYLQSNGYIVVKNNGDIGAFDILDLRTISIFLINNTKLDTPSTSRHDFGYVYKINHEYFIKLNLQIRFL
jgi:hypothetical protein